MSGPGDLIRRLTWLADALTGTLIMASAGAIAAIVFPDVSPLHQLGPTVAWALLCVVPLALRRQWPRLAIAVVLAETYAFGVLLDLNGLPLGGSGIPILVIAYTVASGSELRPAAVMSAVLWVGALLATGLALVTTASERQSVLEQSSTQVTGAHSLSSLMSVNVLAAVLVFVIGRNSATRRAFATALEDRARAAEANQRAVAAQAVAEERQRIARELHDVIAHHISVMSVLASGARRTLGTNPAGVDEVLHTIEQTSRSVLREMRRLLAALRGDESETSAQMTPQPGIAQLNDLVAQVRETGLPVRMLSTVDLAALEVDPGLALTVYRIVQEALTNTIKHAGPSATAEVLLRVEHGVIELEISDTGRGPVPGHSSPGHGLLGMRERVAVFGGRLRVGPRPGGGYRLYASFPLDQAR